MNDPADPNTGELYITDLPAEELAVLEQPTPKPKP